ncbi:uncharacterized protein EDB91DRAFT_1216377 [Suillus paluster]|uniref:uncharacterized protein n=1 Tax=Suillus paluster TaxID=48578 RepID=UPI001B87AA0A|nr:uncharacterized protein EDB91DRAFT_1216377 [Suillus paluster]KAG1752708.1 hypothetical protein EDB91DRAFT_1216377 [Suillus paluster]
MRRIASVFVSRRTDKPDAPSTTSSNDADHLPQEATKRKARLLSSLSRKSVPQSLPQLLASGSANSSSSTSSGSAELRTPDEELPRRMPSQKTSWKSWLGAKKHTNEGDLKAAWLPPLSTSGIALRPPPRSNEMDEASSESEDEADHVQDPPVQNFAQSNTQARNSMKAIILNSSANSDRPSCPPLLDIPDSTPFPRSCLRLGHVRRRDTLESKVHRRALLRMLESLSSAEERGIAPLARRPEILVKEATSHNSDVDTWPKPQFLRRNSEGLGNWAARPCFEDRVLVWTRQEPSGQIVTTGISGSQFGVAALEFSEPLQILAGLLADVEDDFDPSPEPRPELSPPDSGTSAVALPSTEQLTASVAIADVIFSPLTLAVDSQDTLESKNEPSNPRAAEPTPAPLVKRGVRFAEDGKDDQIPLGYVLRIKKKREEKAKFLREEREKRELEEGQRAREEKRMREEQRRLWEAEKKEQEMERMARELQKKKIEEEKRHQNYAADLQASRARSEASRAGYISSSSLVRDMERDRSSSRDAHQSGSLSSRAGRVSSSSSLVRDMERDRSASRDTHQSGLLPTRQRTLDLMVPTANLSPYDGSPTSSMPATPGSQRSFSRPPSVYSTHTTSSEDVRARDGRRISKRSSLAFDPSKQFPLPLPNPRASLLPYNPWGNVPVPAFFVPPVPPVPAVPMMMSMPFYSLDPLLPPSPPFMMNQFGMQPYSANSSQGQVSSSQRRNSSSNHSAEGVRRTSRAAPNSPELFPIHQRRASDEARGHSSSTNATSDRKYGSQTDLRDKRSSQAAHSSRSSSGLHRSHQPPALVHTHTAPARPGSTSQSRSTPSRRQSVYP